MLKISHTWRRKAGNVQRVGTVHHSMENMKVLELTELTLGPPLHMNEHTSSSIATVIKDQIVEW